MPDWRKIPARHEVCRKQISSKRIGASGMVHCFGGAPDMVDYLVESLGLVLFGRSFR